MSNEAKTVGGGGEGGREKASLQSRGFGATPANLPPLSRLYAMRKKDRDVQ